MLDSKKRNAFRRVLVPVTGTSADDETMRMACWIARRDKSKLYAMYVITIDRSRPLETEMPEESRRAEELLGRMEKIAKSEDCKLETDLLQAREVAPTIIDEAVERQIDLIVMGIHHQQRFGQFTMGQIIPYVLKNASCEVILYSQYNHQEPG